MRESGRSPRKNSTLLGHSAQLIPDHPDEINSQCDTVLQHACGALSGNLSPSDLSRQSTQGLISPKTEPAYKDSSVSALNSIDSVLSMHGRLFSHSFTFILFLRTYFFPKNVHSVGCQQMGFVCIVRGNCKRPVVETAVSVCLCETDSRVDSHEQSESE